jgi:choline kinase
LTARAIILAAGVGSRLSAKTPKCLLPLGSSTLLERQTEFLVEAGVKKENVFVVAGFMSEKVRLIHDNLLLNNYYRETNNAFSLYIALEHLQQLKSNDEVLVLDGDLVFNRNLIQSLLKDPHLNLLVSKKECLPGDSTEEVLLMDNNARITNIHRFSSFESKQQSVYAGVLKASTKTAGLLYRMLWLQKCWRDYYTAAFEHLFSAVSFYDFPLSEPSFCVDIDTKIDYDKVCSRLLTEVVL